MQKIWHNYSSEISLVARLSVWVGAPAVAALLAGNWLDNRWGTAPWLMLICAVSGFAISMFGLIKEATKALKSADQSKDRSAKS